MLHWSVCFSVFQRDSTILKLGIPDWKSVLYVLCIYNILISILLLLFFSLRLWHCPDSSLCRFLLLLLHQVRIPGHTGTLASTFFFLGGGGLCALKLHITGFPTLLLFCQLEKQCETSASSLSQVGMRRKFQFVEATGEQQLFEGRVDMIDSSRSFVQMKIHMFTRGDSSEFSFAFPLLLTCKKAIWRATN